MQDKEIEKAAIIAACILIVFSFVMALVLSVAMVEHRAKIEEVLKRVEALERKK